MNAYKKYVTIDNFQQLVLGNLPFKPGQKVEVIILTEYDQETELKQSDCILLENIEDEPFVGMWKDREDLKDSSQWVRQIRKQEWTN